MSYIWPLYHVKINMYEQQIVSEALHKLICMSHLPLGTLLIHGRPAGQGSSCVQVNYFVQRIYITQLDSRLGFKVTNLSIEANFIKVKYVIY